MTAATVMIVALGGGQRMELFGRVLCHHPWKSGRRTGGSEEGMEGGGEGTNPGTIATD